MAAASEALGAAEVDDGAVDVVVAELVLLELLHALSDAAARTPTATMATRNVTDSRPIRRTLPVLGGPAAR